MIKASNIVKRFGTQTVLTDVSLEARDREIFGLLGPSGAGKTTIINILTKQLDADGGSFDTGATLRIYSELFQNDALSSRFDMCGLALSGN